MDHIPHSSRCREFVCGKSPCSRRAAIHCTAVNCKRVHKSHSTGKILYKLSTLNKIQIFEVKLFKLSFKLPCTQFSIHMYLPYIKIVFTTSSESVSLSCYTWSLRQWFNVTTISTQQSSNSIQSLVIKAFKLLFELSNKTSLTEMQHIMWCWISYTIYATAKDMAVHNANNMNSGGVFTVGKRQPAVENVGVWSDLQRSGWKEASKYASLEATRHK